MESRLEIEEKKKLISECLKLEIELKSVKKKWRVKKKRNLGIKQHNKVLNDELVVLRRRSLKDGDYQKAIQVKECKILLYNVIEDKDNTTKSSMDECQVVLINNEIDVETTDQEESDHSTSVKRYKCQHPGCKRKFILKKSLILHKNVHNKKYQCQKCEKCFPTPTSLKIHRRTHTGERPFVCDWEGCDQRFTRDDLLNRHVKSKHSNKRPFHCDYVGCGKSFKRKDYFEKHLKNHLALWPFQCQLLGCGEQFNTTTHLINHLKKHKKMLNDDELGMLKVNDIKKVIAVNESGVFVGDLLKKSREEIFSIFKCQHPGCEKTFKKKISLKTHKNIHTTKYQCQHCQKCFHSPSHLKIHLRIHTGERPFECNWVGCGKKFKSKEHLKLHKIKHSNERSFQCNENGCDKRFKTKKVLNKHKRTKHSLLV